MLSGAETSAAESGRLVVIVRVPAPRLQERRKAPHPDHS